MIRRPAPHRRPPPRPNPLMAQARNVAKVRYGPEESALSGILSGAQQDLVRGVQIQRDTARGIQAAIKAAKPLVVSAYAGASGSIQKASADVNHDMATLSAAADPYRATMDTEAAASRQRLAEGVAAAQNSLAQQKVQAEQGRAYGEQGLARTYVDAATKVRDRQLSLGQEKGAFIASTFGDLQGAAAKAQSDAQAAAEKRAIDMAKLAQGDRALNISAFKATHATPRAPSTRSSSSRSSGGPRGSSARGGPKPFTYTQSQHFVSQVGSLVPLLRQARQHGARNPRADLRSGRNPTGKPVTFDDNAYNAAMDLVVHGRLSSANQAFFRHHGITIPGRFMRRPAKPRLPSVQHIAHLVSPF